MSEETTACMAALCLEQKHLSKVRMVEKYAAELPMGGDFDSEEWLYKKIRGAEYSKYCNPDGEFKSIGLGILFWWDVGKILWTIIRWWLNRRNT